MSTSQTPASSHVTGRRSFLTTAGIAAAGLGAFGLATPEFAAAQAADPANANLLRRPSRRRDADILNLALNLEYLEAEFYLRAVGQNDGLAGNISGKGAQGDVTGGKPVTFTNPAVEAYAMEIAADERAHVLFLRTALAGAAVARPAIDFEQSFTTAARAAGLIPADATFDAFANDITFLLAAFIFEDVGVTAYKGAAPLLLDKGVLEAAAGILAVEAYHAGTIRTTLFALRDTEVAPGLTVREAVQRISDLRDALAGPEVDDDQGVVGDGLSNDDNGDTGDGDVANTVPTDANGLAFSRTPRQVLNIVYGSPDSPTKGLFFPNGLNGTIK